ncbi:MAG TPA: hypothetical protein VHT27_01890 [Solirubrobacteraceae bacterium]|jgi:hypothetical protein|nr:hypothetical protein [Solirubrobacteraceae bacterium]
MLSRIGRRRLTFANITATVALIFAMSGGALAATHYLLTSTKQISPKVLSALRGNAGAAGPAGPQGQPGASGKEGTAGKEGPPGVDGTAASISTVAGTLQAGKTETGTWAFTKNAPGQIRVPLSLPIPTKEPLQVGFHQSGEEDPSPHCRGSEAKPQADPGYLCVYSEQHEDPLNAVGPVRTSGVVLIYESSGTAAPQVNEGTWAATGS